MSSPKPSRTEVRDYVPCPACKVAAGQKCERARGGERESNHQERVNRYLAWTSS